MTRAIRITLTERETDALIAAITAYLGEVEGEPSPRTDQIEDVKAHDRILAKISRERRKP